MAIIPNNKLTAFYGLVKVSNDSQAGINLAECEAYYLKKLNRNGKN
ncbi:MAG: hypothetical protein ACJASL_001356 [Paraglaciecola sp.]|jgi:hypothetical protein